MTRLRRRAPVRRARAPPGPEAWAPLWRRRGRSARPLRSRQRATDVRTGRVACTPDVPLPVRRDGRRSPRPTNFRRAGTRGLPPPTTTPLPPSATRARAPCGAASHRTPPGAAQRGGPSRARRPYGPTTTTPLAPAPAAARRARYARFCGSDPDPIVRKLLPRVRFDFDGKRKPAVTAGTGWHLSFGDSTHFDLAYQHALPPPPTTRAGSKGGFFGSA